ncbi:unnamed protein product [Ectocarpus sp. 8 AP-2014]
MAHVGFRTTWRPCRPFDKSCLPSGIHFFPTLYQFGGDKSSIAVIGYYRNLVLGRIFNHKRTSCCITEQFPTLASFAADNVGTAAVPGTCRSRRSQQYLGSYPPCFHPGQTRRHAA